MNTSRLRFVPRRLLRLYVERFPLAPGKERLVSLLWRPLSFGSFEAEAHLRAFDLRLQCDISKHIQRHLYFWGGYEAELCTLWARLARNARSIFDIGANVGLYSLIAARSNAEARVHAFEPTRALADIIAANVGLNGLVNVYINPVAVGRGSYTGHLREFKGENEGMNFLTPVAEPVDSSVPVVSVGDYCALKSVERVDLMKIDAEGGEYDVLRGAATLLTDQAIGGIFIELCELTANRSGHSTLDIQALLRAAGYRIYALRGQALREIPEPLVFAFENVVALSEEYRRQVGLVS